jgi:hypothetical protein
MITAIEGLIPDRRAISAQNEPAPPVNPPFYVAEWLRNQQQGENADPQPAPAQEVADLEPQSASSPDPTPIELSSRPELRRSVEEGPAVPGPLNPSQTTPSLPRVPMADYFAPDTRVPFSVKRNPFNGRRR